MADERCEPIQRLKGLTLWRSTWVRPSGHWDHDHCAGCWATFSDRDAADVLRAGYTTGPDYSKGARYEWVCDRCFAELKDEMNWTIGGATIVELVPSQRS